MRGIIAVGDQPEADGQRASSSKGQETTGEETERGATGGEATVRDNATDTHKVESEMMIWRTKTYTSVLPVVH